MKHLRFEHCKTAEDMLEYFVRKTPSAKSIHTKDFRQVWLPKLGAVCVDIEGIKEGYPTRVAAIEAARKYHNMVSEKLNLKPIYQS